MHLLTSYIAVPLCRVKACYASIYALRVESGRWNGSKDRCMDVKCRRLRRMHVGYAKRRYCCTEN